MSLPFGLKAPSRGTVIFTSIVGTIGGGYYASSYYVENSRKSLNNRVSWLADCPCGVHERPRKVQVFITTPPGDGLEKSRTWFSHYVKPVLVAAAIDYEIKEAREPGQIEALVRDEVIKRRQLEKEASLPSSINDNDQMNNSNNNMLPLQQQPNVPSLTNKEKEQTLDEFDGVIAIGRKAWGEVLNGLNKGCQANLIQVEKEKKEAELKKKLEEEQKEKEKNTSSTEEKDSSSTEIESIDNDNNNSTDEPLLKEEEIVSTDIIFNDNNNPLEELPLETEKDKFSVPKNLSSPLIYIPHENIIGWTNIPYRIYMWLMDYQRIDRFGDYAVNVALNKTRPLEIDDLDVGYQEIKYWIGDDDAKKAKEDDQPIQIDERVRKELKTYTNEN
ncbi:unnamed protein product [Cunninghamella blakesleeana]